MGHRLTAASLGAAMALSACGGGEVGGTVTGLTADGLSLSSGLETISVASGATSFTFPTLVDDGRQFTVVVVTQPTGLQCSVQNGSGTASTNVTVSDVSVSCVPVWNLSGTINGLTRTGLVLANGTESITVEPLAASFAFPTRLSDGAPYLITVTTQPPGQTCTVTNGEGTVTGAPVSNVAIACR